MQKVELTPKKNGRVGQFLRKLLLQGVPTTINHCGRDLKNKGQKEIKIQCVIEIHYMADFGFETR